MPLDQNPHQKVTRFGCVGFSMYACRFSVLQIQQFRWFTYPPRTKWASSGKIFAKIGIFCKSIAGPLSETITHWMVQELKPIELCIASYQGCYAKLVSMMSPKCSIVETDSELILMALHTHLLPSVNILGCALFLTFHALVYRWGCQFLSLFSQDNEHTELTLLLFFQNPSIWMKLFSIIKWKDCTFK